MKKISKIALIISSLLAFNSYASNDERLNALEQSVLDLEIKSLFNKINFSGDLLTSGVYTDSEQNTSGLAKTNRSLIVNNLQLHATSIIGKRFKIFTTLEASYYHGEGLIDSSAPSHFINEEIDGDHIRVSRAYFDFHIFEKELVFSLGRFPTTNGPPSHMYYLEERMGTYPLMAYSVPVDASALTWNVKKTFNLKDSLSVRLITGKAHRGSRTAADSGGSAPIASNLANKKPQDDSVLSAMLEYGTRELPFGGKALNFIFQYIKGHLGASSPSLVTAQGVGYALKPLGVTDEFYQLSINGDELASFDIYNAYFELLDTFGTNLDFYVNYKYSNIKNEANFQLTSLSETSKYGDTGSGLFGAKGTRTHGSSTLLGARYKFTNSFAAGAEYFFASHGSMPTTFWTKNKLDIYSTYGKTWHAYLAKTFYNQSVTTGFGVAKTDHNYEFTTGYIATQRKTNKAYAFINLKF